MKGSHVLTKIKEVGLRNCIVGMTKRGKYKKMQTRYQFDAWHISPYELRKYVQVVAEYVSDKQADVVIDIGCGLGELLRHTKAKQRIGLDLSKEVIEAAAVLGGNISYIAGSFEQVAVLEPIDYLITLNFMHGGTNETWIPHYADVAKRNDIRHFIVDTVPDDGASHRLEFEKILPSEYQMIDRMGPFLGDRYIEVYKKAEK